MHLIGNRPRVELTLEGPAGSTTGMFVVDTGGSGFFLLSEATAERSGMTFTPREGSPLPVGEAPRTFMGDAELDLGGIEAAVIREEGFDGLIGARILSRYDVTFDFPGRTITLAPPGTGTRRGTRIPVPMTAASFPRIEIEVDGRPFGFLLDTGASFTMVSETVLSSWADEHKSWLRHTGARGDAAMGVRDEAKLTMMMVPSLRWDAFTFTDVGVVGRPAGTFEEWMSRWMPAPIVGALGCNVLRDLRFTIDYVEQAVYVERGA